MTAMALIFLFFTMLLASSAHYAHAEIKVLDKPLWVFPGQQFRIALEQPAGSGQLGVDVPDSLVMFDQDGDRLILFTRDQAKQQAYKLLVPLAAVEEKKTFRFPFTDESAKVKESEIRFEELKSR